MPAAHTGRQRGKSEVAHRGITNSSLIDIATQTDERSENRTLCHKYNRYPHIVSWFYFHLNS